MEKPFKKGDIIHWDIVYHIGRVKSLRKLRGRRVGYDLTVEILYGKPFYFDGMVGTIHHTQVGLYNREYFNGAVESNKMRRVPLEDIDWNKLESLVPS